MAVELTISQIQSYSKSITLSTDVPSQNTQMQQHEASTITNQPNAMTNTRCSTVSTNQSSTFIGSRNDSQSKSDV